MRTFYQREWVQVMGLLALVGVAFSNAITNGFVNWDDPVYLLENPLIKDLTMTGIFNMFREGYGYFTPLTYLSWSLEYRLQGFNPSVYHLHNVLLHLANTLLVYWTIKALAGDKATAWVTAIIFGIHPMHVEAVTWVTERKELLFAWFFLLTVLSYIRYTGSATVEKGPVKFLWLAVLLNVLAFLCKPSAVATTPVLFLIDYYKNRDVLSRKVILEKTPFIVLALLSSASTLAICYGDNLIKDFSDTYTFFQRTMMVFYTFGFYVFHLLVPFNLTVFHRYPDLQNGWLPWVYYASPLVPLSCAIWIVRIKGPLKRDLIFGALFFTATIFVFLNFFPLYSLASERYTYIPYIGLAFILGRILMYLRHQDFSRRVSRTMLVLFIAMLAVLTYARNTDWKDSRSLWSDAIDKDPFCYVAHNQLGEFYMQQKDYGQALKHFEQAAAINDIEPKTMHNRGLAHAHLKNYHQAIADFSRAISLKPDYEKAYSNRGIAYLKTESYTKAFDDFNKSISFDTENQEAHYFRGILHYAKGDPAKACSDWRQAAQLGHPDARKLMMQYCTN